ncbi:TauD/TfdA dioxygenase family protein [Vreelandella sp. GE22]
MLEFVPITDSIGTEVRGIDVNAKLSDDTIEALYDAWISSTILLFRGQSMSPEQQLEFSRNFGELVSYTRSQFSEKTQPEILILSNITNNGKLIGSPVSGRVWHTDGHYLEVPPAGSMLHALETPPEGGDTWFANMFAAYEALPEAVKHRIEHLKVVISRAQSRPYNYPDRPAPSEQELAEWVDVAQPLVRRHEVSGRKALYAGGNVPWRIEGLPLEESAPLVTFLQEFSVQPQFTYRHVWTPGDIILWDNRSAMHKATVYDDKHRRLLHRTTIGARIAESRDRNHPA